MLSFYSFYWNNFNPANNNFLNVIICSHITFNWVIKKVFSINHNFVIFISTFGRYYPVCIFLSSSFSNKIKSLFSPWKLGSIKKCKYWLCLLVEIFDWYLFQLIVLLKPDFNCSSSFALSWVDKVMIGTQSFVSVIANFVSPVAEEIIHYSDQVKMGLILQ